MSPSPSHRRSKVNVDDWQNHCRQAVRRNGHLYILQIVVDFRESRVPKSEIARRVMELGDFFTKLGGKRQEALIRVADERSINGDHHLLEGTIRGLLNALAHMNGLLPLSEKTARPKWDELIELLREKMKERERLKERAQKAPSQ